MNSSVPKARSESSAERRALVVVGMHRSGTSAMTRTLSLLGATLPKGLMPPAPGNNDTGFWEPTSIAALNDEILQALDSEWDDVFSFRPREYLSNFDHFYLGKARELLETEFNGAELIVLKDPRVSVLTTFWDRALREAGYATSYIAMVRNPLEVAESLRSRDSFPREKSLLLWSSYMLALERDTRDRRRVFVCYNELLSDWRAARRRIESAIGIPFPRDTSAAANDIDRFLDHRLRHHESEGERVFTDRDIPDQVGALYRIFLDACSGGAIDHEAVARIYAELCEIERLIGPIDAGWRAKTRDLQRQLEDKAGVEEQLANEAAAKEAAEAQLAGIAAEKERIEAAIADAVRHAESLEAALAQSAANTESAEAALGEAVARNLVIEEELAGLRLEQREQLLERERLLDEQRARLVTAEKEVAKLETQLGKLNEDSAAKLRKSEADRSAAQAAARSAESNLNDRFQELATLTQLLRQQEQHTDSAREQLDWLIAVQSRVLSQPKWWNMMPAAWRSRKSRQRLQRAGLFDADAYLQRYPDVGAAGMDPLDHYVRHGMHEGRSRKF